MFLLVTLRFLSNLSITLIASLFYFFHVSAVCFNVTLKLSTGAHKGPVIIEVGGGGKGGGGGVEENLGGLQFFWMEYGYWGGLKRQKMTLGGGSSSFF